MKAFLRVPAYVVDIVVEDTWVIINPKIGSIYTLNLTGSILWQVLREGRDWKPLAHALAHHTQQPVTRVLEEMVHFIDELLQRGLLVHTERALASSPPDISLPDVYEPPAILLALPLESRAGTPLGQDPDPLLDPLSPFRLIEDGQKGGGN